MASLSSSAPAKLTISIPQVYVFYVEDCGESNAECCVHLVGVDRVMYF